MLNLKLVHRTSDVKFNIDSKYVWKTCLRQISFLNEVEILATDEVYSGIEALQFLCEVISGLRSPVFGETEVQSQFKQFFLQLPDSHILKSHSDISKLIFNTVKETRQKYLNPAGQLSYGQILRRKLKNKNRIFLWGFGLLGQKISLWLKHENLIIIARNPQKVEKNLTVYKEIPAHFLSEIKSNCHVIAANIQDDVVLKLAEQDATDLIYDLRDESKIKVKKIITLQMFLREIEILKQEQKKILPVCQEMIKNNLDNLFFKNGTDHAIR